MSGRLPTYYDYKEQFNIPTDIIYIAKEASKQFTSNHPKAIVCAASIILACDLEGFSLTAEELCSLSSIPSERIERVNKEMKDELGY